MRYILLFLLVICVVLWVERLYWKRKAQLMAARLAGADRSTQLTSLFDAWLDGRIEAEVNRRRSSPQ